MIYQILIHRFQEPLTSQSKYEEELDINEDDWRSIYSLPFMCCGDVKMQMFQYKINMRCLMTNDRLYRMNIINDNLCSLCTHDVETNETFAF